MNGLLIISIAALDLLNVTTVISFGAMWNMKLLTNNQVRNELKKTFFCSRSSISGCYFHWSINRTQLCPHAMKMNALDCLLVAGYPFSIKLESWSFHFIYSAFFFQNRSSVEKTQDSSRDHNNQIYLNYIPVLWQEMKEASLFYNSKLCEDRDHVLVTTNT